MRIYTKILPPEAGFRCFFSVLLHHKKSHLMGNVDFLLDTGAAKTTISEKDARRLNINYDSLTRTDKVHIGVGGIVNVYLLKGVELLFKSDQGIVKEKFDEIEVIKTPGSDQHSITAANRIPSLIGCDFLEERGYRLIFDLSGKKVYIER